MEAKQLTRSEQFLHELNRIEQSSEYAFADYLALLNQPIDELYYLVYFEGVAADYDYLFEITPLYIHRDQTFLKDIVDIHLGVLENHMERYFQAFERAGIADQQAAVETLQQDVPRLDDLQHLLQPWLGSTRYPSVGLHFAGLFGSKLLV